jgi:hypothetical protein
MKKILFTVMIFLFTIGIKAQSISVNDLIKLTDSKISIVNERLINKDWDFYSSDTKTNYWVKVWSYKAVNNSIHANSWLIVKGKENSDNVFSTEMQFADNKVYNSILVYLKAIKALKTNSKSQGGSIKDYYNGENYLYILTSNSSTLSVNKFSILVVKRIDYLLETNK